MRAQYFAKAPADSIAHHGAAERAADAHAEAAALKAVRGGENDKLPARPPAAVAIDAVELRLVEQPGVTGEAAIRV